MADILDLLRRRTDDGWLVGCDSCEFLELTEQVLQEFTQEFTTTSRRYGDRSILIAEPDPIRFWAGFLAAQITHQQIFLGDPHWGEWEWRQALTLAQPDQIWGSRGPEVSRYGQDLDFSLKADLKLEPPLIMIPTGGSSGVIRFVMHRWQTLAAAVAGLHQHLGGQEIHSACVLPLHHVSGLMQGLRSLLSGGSLWLGSFQALKRQHPAPPASGNWSISLVPTQLRALLDCPHIVEWLSGCRAIFLGGAPSWPDLLDQARQAGLPLAPCYGMTETAAQIATLTPERFLAGYRGVGQVLPHAQVRVVDDQGETAPPDTQGQIMIRAESLALGYYPDPWPQETGFCTDDVGYLNQDGCLHLVGRMSTKIITGGENVFPSEVEAVIRATGLVADVAVFGVPDPYWGQRVVAAYVPRDLDLTQQDLENSLQLRISKFKHPKLWISVKSLPRNSHGKLSSRMLRTLIPQRLL